MPNQIQDQEQAFSWPDYLKNSVIPTVNSNKIKARSDFFSVDFVSIIKNQPLPEKAVPLVLKTLFPTLLKYVDRNSRLAVISLLRELGSIHPVSFAQAIFLIISPEVDKLQPTTITSIELVRGIPGYRFSLLVWVNLALEYQFRSLKSQKEFKFDKTTAQLVDLQARLLWGLCSATSTNMAIHKQNGMFKSAQSNTRRLVRTYSESIYEYLSFLTQGSISKTPYVSVLLGNIISTAARLKNFDTSEKKTKIFEVIETTLLSSKSLIPYPSVASLGEFISDFVDEDIFSSRFQPVVKKMMLRQPENIIHCLIFASEFISFDFSTLFSEYYADSLLSIITKTSNKNTQEKSQTLFKLLAQKSTNFEKNLTVVKHIFNTLSTNKSGSLDTKTIISSLLDVFIKETDNDLILFSKISENILEHISKENQEIVIASLLESLSKYLQPLVSDNIDPSHNIHLPTIKKVLQAAKNGISNPGKKVSVRKAWINSVIGLVAWNLYINSSEISYFNYFSELADELFSVVEKIQKNPLGSGFDSSEGYASLAILLTGFNELAENKKQFLLKVISSSSDQSFLFSEKVYHKLSNDTDSIWLLNAILASYNLFSTSEKEHATINSQFPKPIIWTFINQKTEVVRNTLYKTVKRMSNIDTTGISEAFIPELIDFMNQNYSNISLLQQPEDNHLYTSPQSWFSLLSNLVPDIKNITKADQILNLLTSLALPAHSPLILEDNSERFTWLSILQASGQDPLEICDKASITLLDKAQSSLTEFGVHHPQGIAAYNMSITLSFVLGEKFCTQALKTVKGMILNSDVVSITNQDIIIWDTPPNQLAFDPLSSKQIKSPKGSAKDKWDEDLRAEINRKRIESRKLSKEEVQQIEEQKTFENSVRNRLQKTYNSLAGSLKILAGIVSGNVEAARENAPGILELVLKDLLSSKNAEWLLNNFVGNTLIEICKLATGISPSLRTQLAIGLLRTGGFNSCCDQQWLTEPLESLVSSDIDDLNISANHDEYTVLSQATEQVAIASEIICANAKKASSSSFPRVQFIKAAILLMSKYNQFLAKGKDAILTASTCIEDLELDLSAERHAVVDGLLQKDSVIRATCLEALASYSFGNPNSGICSDIYLTSDVATLWIFTCDSISENSELALELWNGFDLSMNLEIIRLYVSKSGGFLNHPLLPVRQSVSKAISTAILEISKSNFKLSSGNAESDKISDKNDSNNHDGTKTETITKAVDIACFELQSRYIDWNISLDPEYDQYGIVIPETANKVDPFESRVSVAWAIKHLAPLMDSKAQAEPMVKFLLDKEALGDRNSEVREAMLEAGVEIVSSHKFSNPEVLIDYLELWLSKPEKNTNLHDSMRESIIVLLGTLASNLPNNDSRIASAVKNLVVSLHTPSESVQYAVASTLVLLAKKLDEEEVEKLVKHLLGELFTGKKYAIRRGAAYGLAGIVKGCGLFILRKYNIIDKLKESATDRKSMTSRQGSLFALETMSSMLGRLFEPYMIQVLPLMLKLFGDPSSDVREATSYTSKAIMGQLSGYGVKLVLPSLLAGLESDIWRTKKGSTEMLGSMAFCAPKQLSLALPAIVPHLVELSSDSHSEVSEAARRALLNFGSVIHNPEIMELVPSLLSALSDPTNKTNIALQKLLDTAFVHYIDAPSLALIAPVLERGMKERKTTVKRHAAQVFGSMALLSEPSDLILYLPKMIPLLKAILSDPVPETRGTAAKALGQLISRLGEDKFESLIDELLNTLQTSSVGIDRAGAAQALSEVLYGIGIERLDILIPDVINGFQNSQPSVRDGYMLLLLYLPSTFGDEFIPYLDKLVSPVLRGLADETENVRTTSMRVGQTFVAFYSSKASDKLINGLLIGLRDYSWRIRKASVELLGDLIMRIVGRSGKLNDSDQKADLNKFDNEMDDVLGRNKDGDYFGNESEEEETITVENIKKSLGEALGETKRDHVIAALYIARNDVVASVRQSSIPVWKSLTSNTPRTVKECLEPLVELVLEGLSSTHEERRSSSAQTLGDMVRKLGQAVIQRVIPILESGLKNTNLEKSSRQGIFIGLSEILSSTSSVHVEEYGNAIVPLVRVGLCDSDSMVRVSAAAAFDSLLAVLGPKVMEDVVPFLLSSLTQYHENEQDSRDFDISSEDALRALQELMSIRSNLLLPTLIPSLTTEPISAFHATALESLVTIAGPSSPPLQRRISSILSSLFNSLYTHFQSGDLNALSCCRKAVSTISAIASKDDNTLNTLMGLLFDAVSGSEALSNAKARETEHRKRKRIEGCYAVASVYQAVSPGSASQLGNGIGKYINEWIFILVGLLSTDDKEIITAAQSALAPVCKSIPKVEMIKYIGVVSKSVRSVAKNLDKDAVTVPGFNIPNGILPLLPIYTHSLLEGSVVIKEASILGISDLVKYTKEEYLKSQITSITGPLIRIVGDRIPPEVRSAVISSLGLLLFKTPQYLRPFLPQLQRTFVKFLSDNDTDTRKESQKALSILIPLQPRLDPLIAELTSNIKVMVSSISSSSHSSSTPIFESCASMIKSLKQAMLSCTEKNISDSSFKSIETCLLGNEMLSIHDRRIQAALADALPTFLRIASQISGVLGQGTISRMAVAKSDDEPEVIEGKMRTTISLLQSNSDVLLGPNSVVNSKILCESVICALNSNELQAVLLGILASIQVLQHHNFYSDKTSENPYELSDMIVEKLYQFIDPESKNASFIDSEIKQSVFVAFKRVSNSTNKECQESIMKSKFKYKIVYAAFSYVRSRQIPLKLSAERCILYTLHLAKTPNFSKGSSNVNTHFFEEYIQFAGGLDSEQGKIANDYYKRVLIKLANNTFEEGYQSDDDNISEENRN
ncbi:hypothetical protein BB558_000655 [Smittium angustum]|uniref:TOG domain-containing protein n=1 Tax=Smittium angustum TaxID=133377 RepID=A0A2U1JDL1_SMIAN|nr:hypothetical protein BB558_000655 [Smittium angustum]